MVLGQLIEPEQLTDPGVNFASVHGLMAVTVHMSFSLHRATSRDELPIVKHWVTPPCRVNFSPCEQNAKVAPGQE